MNEFDESNPLWTKGIIEHNQRWLLAYLYASTGDKSLAEDLVQETFVVAFKKRDELASIPSFGAWLRGIARNVVRRHFEKRAREPVLMSDHMLEHMEQSAAALEQVHLNPEYHSEKLSVMRECLKKLSHKARLLIEGRYQDELSIDELSRRTGLTSGSVPVVLHRARAMLSECIKKNMAQRSFETTL